MKLQTVHHVAILVKDYEKSRHFYVDLLGFAVIRENYRPEKDDYKLDLAVGDLQLEIFSAPNAPARVTGPEALGLRHLAFRVDNVAAAVEELTALGIEAEPIRIDPYSGGAFTFFFDPDGLPLELHE